MTPLRRAVIAVAAPLAVALIKLLWATCRFELRGDERVREYCGSGQPLILTHWHDSIFIAAWYLMALGRQGLGVTYLVSPSADGEFAVRMLSVLGGRAVRGSATRSGVKAMHRLYRAMKQDNASPVVVPDGPQGPPHECKMGPVMLAKLADAPILPVGCAARSVWRLKTWDRLQIPRPFTRVAVVVGRPVVLAGDLTDEERESRRAGLESNLEQLVGEAESLCRLNQP